MTTKPKASKRRVKMATWKGFCLQFDGKLDTDFLFENEANAISWAQSLSMGVVPVIITEVRRRDK